MSEETSPDQKDPTEFLLAEYATLRDLRQSMASVGESRFNIYLGILTGSFAIIGILLDSQSNHPLTPILVSALLIALLLIGMTTFVRIVDRTINMALYNRGINRIRRYFVEKNPEIAKFVILPVFDDTPSFKSMSLKAGGAGATGLSQTIAILNSMVAGAIAPILTFLIFKNIEAGALLGVVIILAIYFIQSWYHKKRVQKAERTTTVNFPSVIENSFDNESSKNNKPREESLQNNLEE